MEKQPRFLDMYHAGVMQAGEIHSFIEVWHRTARTGSPCSVSLHVFLGLTWDEFSMWATLGDLPTEREHQLHGRQDMAFVIFVGDDPGDTTPLRTHGPLRCRPACPIHWPSGHAQETWPQGWDPDKGVMTRLCGHGVHHPDPDDQQVRLHPDLAEHDCDGCCKPTIDGEVRAALHQLDGSAESAVALRAGIPRAELGRYGGMPS